MRKVSETIIPPASMVTVRDYKYNKYSVYVKLYSINEDDYKYLHIEYTSEIPTIESIEEEFEAYINEYISEEIKNCTWNNYQVQLTKENQFNYKMIYDYSKDCKFANLPVVLKLNSSKDIDKKLYKFENKDELKDFYKTCIEHVQNTLLKSWDIKKNFDKDYYIKQLLAI